jgi:O-antigen ligase
MLPASSAEISRPAEPRGLFVAAAIMLAASILAGGGGVRFPFTELIVQLVSVAALVAVLIAWRWRTMSPGFRMPMLLGALMLGLILLQLVPLPPANWTGMAGRELAADTARALGSSTGWRPLSIDPEATMRSALALIPGLTMVMAMAMLPPASRLRLVRLLAILAAAMLIPGLLQIASGGDHFYLYSAASSSSHRGVPTGLFVNRNHFAAFLLVAIVACGALARRETGKPALLPVVLGTALAAMTLATASRTGAILLPFAVLASALLARRHVDRRTWLIVAISIALAAMVLAIATYHGFGGSLDRLVARFGEDEDSRFEFWPVALAVAQTWFPWGSGVGTFDMAFRAGEPLAIVGSHFVNHAHNDYLEIAIEAGMPGMLLVAAFLGWLVRAGWKAWRDPLRGDADLYARMAFAGIALLLLHSLVDYPLRTLALETIFGLLIGLLAAHGNDFKASKPENTTERPA